MNAKLTYCRHVCLANLHFQTIILHFLSSFNCGSRSNAVQSTKRDQRSSDAKNGFISLIPFHCSSIRVCLYVPCVCIDVRGENPNFGMAGVSSWLCQTSRPGPLCRLVVLLYPNQSVLCPRSKSESTNKRGITEGSKCLQCQAEHGFKSSFDLTVARLDLKEQAFVTTL